MLQQCHFLLQVRFVWCSFATLIDLSNKHLSLAVFHLVRTCSNKMLCCCKLSCWCILLKCTHVDNKACLLCANKCMHACLMLSCTQQHADKATSCAWPALAHVNAQKCFVGREGGKSILCCVPLQL